MSDATPMTAEPSRFHRLDLVAPSPIDSAIYYEWLLGAPAGDRPGAGLHAIGVEAVRAPERGEKTGWAPVFAVDSIDAATKRLAGFDVTVRVPDARDASRLEVTNPAGVRTGLVEISAIVPGEVSAFGRANVDYFARDLELATHMFEAMLDLPAAAVDDDPYGMRFLIGGGRFVTGVFAIDAAPGVLRAAEWFAYFEVRDISSVIGRAVASGSRVRIAQSRSPFNDFAVLDDPFGQRFGLSEWLTVREPVRMIDADGRAFDLRDRVSLGEAPRTP